MVTAPSHLALDLIWWLPELLLEVEEKRYLPVPHTRQPHSVQLLGFTNHDLVVPAKLKNAIVGHSASVWRVSTMTVSSYGYTMKMLYYLLRFL